MAGSRASMRNMVSLYGFGRPSWVLGDVRRWRWSTARGWSEHERAGRGEGSSWCYSEEWERICNEEAASFHNPLTVACGSVFTQRKWMFFSEGKVADHHRVFVLFLFGLGFWESVLRSF